MTTKGQKWHEWRPTNGAVALFVLLAVIFAAFQWSANQRADRAEETLHTTVQKVHNLAVSNTELVNGLQSAIVEACEEIGNSRAEAQREQLHEEITKAEHPDPALIRALSIPPETIERLTAEQVETLHDRLEKVKLSDCAAQYKITPSQNP